MIGSFESDAMVKISGFADGIEITEEVAADVGVRPHVLRSVSTLDAPGSSIPNQIPGDLPIVDRAAQEENVTAVVDDEGTEADDK